MNQPLQIEKQAGKRIVSKGAYVKAQAQRATVSVLAVVFLGLTALCGFVTIMYLLVCLACLMGDKQWNNSAIPLFLGIIVLFGVGTFTFGLLAYKTMKQATKIEPGVPLTRANTADLPAPDTLVRASTEPLQEQQAVLLRAAAENQERHEEQLVRASADGQK